MVHVSKNVKSNKHGTKKTKPVPALLNDLSIIKPRKIVQFHHVQKKLNGTKS